MSKTELKKQEMAHQAATISTENDSSGINIKAENELEAIADEIDALWILIDALLAEIKRTGCPAEDSLDNVRLLLSNRFWNAHDVLKAISEENHIVKK